MTVIVNTFWGGRVCQAVDRQISLHQTKVIDTQATKICVILCSNALASVAYTGAAAATHRWMDTVIAECFAHGSVQTAMIQPGLPWLARPLHSVIRELSLNLNGRLNSDPMVRALDLRLSLVGWHLGRKLKPFSWEIFRDKQQPDGRRYFRLVQHRVGKFLRMHPDGLWAETLGNPGETVDRRVEALGQANGFNHDDVEAYIADAIAERASETATVGADSLAVQLDPKTRDQVQFTFYPWGNTDDEPRFLSGWVLTPRLVSSPSFQTTHGSSYSACGRYLTGGFTDIVTNLNVATRAPPAGARHGGPVSIRYGTQKRRPAP